ncbi:MAG: hypothetical protein LN411_03060 [Candidatus Thermoplasmatota archaeon]|nr:hypothetical protein [Candidatus Thermoplasmatota archaeon]
MRKYLISAGIIAAVLVCAPIASAGGPNGGWGKGLLSETLLLYEGSAEVADGYLYWIPDSADFTYDFHGYNLDDGTVYYLICFEGAGDEEPEVFTVIGSASVDMCLEDASGVHIKGVMDWPMMDDATVCLVPGSWQELEGSDPWTPDDYLISSETVDLD